MIEEKLEIEIKGKVFGFRNEGEDRDAAVARITLEAEMNGNAGSSRLHLTMIRYKIVPMTQSVIPGVEIVGKIRG